MMLWVMKMAAHLLASGILFIEGFLVETIVARSFELCIMIISIELYIFPEKFQFQ